MSEDKNKVIVQRIEEAIENCRKKNFTMYFFVIDTKGVPNGSMEYIYQLAHTLKTKDYNVCMVYQLENEYTKEELEKLRKKEKPIDEDRVFTNVGEWLGEEYASLPHINITQEGAWKVSASDFLFIPEVFSSLMFQTFKMRVPCKRYAILQNYDYISEFIPFGKEWGDYGMIDAIASNETQSKLLNGIFPYVRTKVINPYIPEYFRKPVKPTQLIVNIVAKKQTDVHRIIKEFQWKNPVYKFVSFRDLRNFPRKDFADLLKEGAITVWLDSTTSFGYSALEAMRCGNIVIGKIPEVIPEWMGNETDGLFDNGIWFNNLNDLSDILTRVIGSWMQDEIPEELTKAMEKTNSRYSYEEWSANIDRVFGEIINERINELETVKMTAQSKIKE